MKKITAILLTMILCIMAFGCEKTESNKKTEKCTILVECSTILDNMDKLDKGLESIVPKSGIILEKRTVNFFEGESVYDVLNRELKKEKILMEASFTAGSAYVEGIDNIYEFSCGELSGWQYRVNGEYPGKSCSEYRVNGGDDIEFNYTCNLGEDIKN